MLPCPERPSRWLCHGTLLVLLAAPLWAQVPQEPGDPPLGPPLYDPRAGMDADGRIPKPEFPADLEHPDRWRYTPPGRIKPGSILERFLVTSFASPILFRNADVGFGGGVALTDIDFRNERYREFANIVLTYSEEGQQAYRMNWSRWLHYRDLPDGGIVREERGRLFARGGYEKTLTRRYFGRGSRSRPEDESSYTEELSALGFGIRDTLDGQGGDWLWRADLHAEQHGLSGGRVQGVPSTSNVEAYAADYARGDGVTQAWLLLSLAHDTRDSLHQPYSGHRVGVSANLAQQSEGRSGGVLGFDAQQVWTLPPLFHQGGNGREEHPPTDSLAIGGYVQETVGSLPFYSLPSLGGGSTLRSYIENRFTDRAAAHGTVEYRAGIVPRGYAFSDTIRIERISAALFYDLGTVAGSVDALSRARWHHSYGVGLRIGFAREAVFRIDVGWGTEGSNFTIGYGNTF
ncbi:MAG: BamA/TamA family outer membrane protein [Planctomycetes bacterium]|nr:BamA/TamA family outer membrane protein [Planctomycetota bacterium]